MAKGDNKLELNKSITVEFDFDKVLELANSFVLPLPVSMRAIEEGYYPSNNGKIFLPAEEIVAAVNTIFYEDEERENFIIHIDHKNQFKESSSVLDRVGKVTKAYVSDKKKGILMLEGIITNNDAALSVYNGVIKKVSLRIYPHIIKTENGKLVGRKLEFQEISLVKNDGYKGSLIVPL